MKIMKFGGTSVGKPQRMHEVARLITADTDKKIVVLSAVSGTTNALVAISQELARGDRAAARGLIDALQEQYAAFVPELVQSESARAAAAAVLHEHFDFLQIILRISWSEALDKDILAQGELLSTKLFSVYLTERGFDHALLPALDFMRIDANDEPQLEAIRDNLQAAIAQHPGKKLFITQGFICRNARGEVDNLKRGGSDYSASLIAAAISADVCEIWTDISGMHNNDPRVVERTVPIGQLSFDEAAELAYFGAKILHPASIWPAQQCRIPVRLLNTMEPTAAGTLITEAASAPGAKAIAAKDGITAVNIKSSRMLLAYGFLRRVFEVFEKHRTPIDMITTSEVAVSVTIDNAAALPEIIGELGALGTVSTESAQTIISIVGHEIASDATMLRRIFDSLEGVAIRMVSYGGSLHNISLLVEADKKKEVLQRLNKGVFDL
jgi:aspartate kinase